MALILKDRVKETTTTTSTGPVTLLGAADGYQSFASIGDGNTTYYTIAAQTGTEWEVGIGTYTSSGTTLSRDTVLSSSNSGSLVNFSAGTKDVFVTQPSERAVYTDATNIVNTSGNAATTVTFTQVNTTNLVANTVTLTAGTITTNAASATDIVNKQYVDGIVAAGVHYHEPVLVESPTALVAVYNQPNGAGNGVGATLTNSGSNVALVIDGVSLSNTARVLVYTQSNAVQNGVYTVTNPGAPDPGGAQWVLTRATDADTYVVASSAGLSEGSTFFVQSGNTGAGEVYTCNTPGVITFGTTNITFAQIGSAQIYSAGTGLSLTNTTFSISNTAVTAATYGDAGTVATFTVNAQGQLTNAANAAINASSISIGTLDNARTTASASNGANTIVLRDANGSFNANVGTFTTVNATNGNFSNITGNAVSLTDINASNITSGTIANARTTGDTANSANTIVLRDANGSFAANIISGAFNGDGSAINAINASNISSGTIDNARTTAASANGASTIVLRDSSGDFSANLINASFTGNGVQITAINASNLTTGTVDNARTTASSANGASTIVLRDTNGSFSANVVNANSFSGNAASLTNINASNISSGTIGSAYVSGAYANITGLGNVTSGTWSANVVSVIYGGTGASTLTANGVIYGNGTSALGATTVGATGEVLLGNTGAAPSWGSVPAGSISGTVAIANGGTGQNTASAAFNALSPVTTTGDLIVGNGTNSSTRLAIGTTGKVLTSNGTTVSWETPDYGGGTITTTDFTATASQTVFSVNYPVGFLQVYQNGVKLGNADFTATNGTSFTLATGATVNDLVEAVVFEVLNLYATITSETFNGTGAQTIFTMSQVPANTASLLAAISGVVQDPSTYTVSGTTLTFSVAPPSGTNNISVRYLGIPSINTVSTFSGGTTGLTPATATAGPVTLAGTLNVANGGTGATTATANHVFAGPTTGAAAAPSFRALVAADIPSAYSQFASGTAIVFKQTAAPTGWTKVTTDNDAALRIVSGSASTGGTVDFTTAFASQAVTGSVAITGATTATNTSYTPAGSVANTGSTTATNTSYTPAGSVGTSGATTLTTAQIPSHSHVAPGQNLNTFYGAGGSALQGWNAPFIDGTSSSTSSTGGGGSHTHSGGAFSGTPATITQNSHTHTSGAFSGTPATITQNSHTHTSGAFTGTAINLAVKYVDVIVATKD